MPMLTMRLVTSDRRMPKTDKDWLKFQKTLTKAFGKYAFYTIDRPLLWNGREGVKVGWNSPDSLHLVGAGLTWRSALTHMKKRRKTWLRKWKEIIAREKKERLEEERLQRARLIEEKARRAKAKKVWISAYAFTLGIFEADALIEKDRAELLEWHDNYRKHYTPGNWHRTKKQAVAAAEKRRQLKLESLRRQIRHLKKAKVLFAKTKAPAECLEKE